MSDKTERQQIFGTDDEEDEYPMIQGDSSKLGGCAPRRDSRVRITNQQKMQAVAHFFCNIVFITLQHCYPMVSTQ